MNGNKEVAVVMLIAGRFLGYLMKKHVTLDVIGIIIISLVNVLLK